MHFGSFRFFIKVVIHPRPSFLRICCNKGQKIALFVLLRSFPNNLFYLVEWMNFLVWAEAVVLEHMEKRAQTQMTFRFTVCIACRLILELKGKLCQTCAQFGTRQKCVSYIWLKFVQTLVVWNLPVIHCNMAIKTS